MSILVAVVVGLLVSLTASAVLILFGGFGGYMLQQRLLRELLDRVSENERAIYRETKRRAGEAGVKARSADDELLAELEKAAKRETGRTIGLDRAEIARRIPPIGGRDAV